jgi:hypothetical protein
VFWPWPEPRQTAKKESGSNPLTDLEAWKLGYRERIAAAEVLLASLPENDYPSSADT